MSRILEGDTSSVFDWFIFYDGRTKFGFSRLHLDITYTLLHHRKYIHRMSVSGIYNCFFFFFHCQWKPAKLSQYFTWRDPLHWCFITHRQTLSTHTHTKSYLHTHSLSCSLHAVPHIRGTKVREHHLMLKDLISTHCSTFGTVFVATLDNFPLKGHMHKHIFF